MKYVKCENKFYEMYVNEMLYGNSIIGEVRFACYNQSHEKGFIYHI